MSGLPFQSEATAMSHTSRPRVRIFDCLTGAGLLLALIVVAWLPAQEAQTPGQNGKAKAEASKERDERLETIEKSLQTLLKEVQSLKQPAGGDQARTAPAQTAVAAT